MEDAQKRDLKIKLKVPAKFASCFVAKSLGVAPAPADPTGSMSDLRDSPSWSDAQSLRAPPCLGTSHVSTSATHVMDSGPLTSKPSCDDKEVRMLLRI